MSNTTVTKALKFNRFLSDDLSSSHPLFHASYHYRVSISVFSDAAYNYHCYVSKWDMPPPSSPQQQQPSLKTHLRHCSLTSLTWCPSDESWKVLGDWLKAPHRKVILTSKAYYILYSPIQKTDDLMKEMWFIQNSKLFPEQIFAWFGILFRFFLKKTWQTEAVNFYNNLCGFCSGKAAFFQTGFCGILGFHENLTVLSETKGKMKSWL